MSDKQWHLERSVSVGHILTTVTLVVAALIYVLRVEGRVDLVERATHNNQERIARVEQRVNVDIAEIKTLLRRIEDKLDRKADR